MNSHQKYIISKDSFKYLIIWLISLLSIKFYSLFLPYQLGKSLIFMGIILGSALYIFLIVYEHSQEFRKEFTLPVVFIFISLIISAIACNYFHDQPLHNTLFEQFELYYFLIYFLLHKLKPNPEKLLNMFLTLGFAYCGVYIIQYFLFPRVIVSSSVFQDRGTVRIFIPGGGFLYTAYFLLLMGFFITKKIKYLVWIIPILIIFFLLGTRQVLASIAMLTIINILMSRTIKSKILTFFLILLCFIPLFFLFEGIFLQMLKVTQEQSTSIEDNVRYRAAHYFLFEFNKNPLWMITGNGMPDHQSSYGRFINSLTETFGFYQSDIGIIGDFSKFGIFFVIGQLWILIKLIRSKLVEKYTFIWYNTLSILMTMFTGAGLHAGTIVLICMMMYIADVNKRGRELEISGG